MDNFENRDAFPEEGADQSAPPVEQPPAQGYPESPVFHGSQPEAPVYQHPSQEPHSYRGAGTGRRESPYANSPYVMYHREQQEQPHFQDPRQQYHSYQQPQYPPQYQQPQYEAPRKPKKDKTKRTLSGFWKKGVSVLVTVVLVAAGCGITAASVNSHWEMRSEHMIGSLNAQIADLREQLAAVSAANSGMTSPSSGEGLTPSQVYAQNVGSVVAISNQSTTTNYFGQVSETASSGSGFILTEDGYVVSNYHVVSGATTLTVILYDGTEYAAKFIGGDKNNDIALLKIEATGLQAVTVGSSDALVVGDQVVAIGNPLGELTSTQTVGYISAKDRDVTTDGTTINMMQTDAAINPGNSGGPLFNMRGEVVGITTAKYSGTTNSGATIEGIGFAIPIDDVLSMLSDLKDYGYVTGAYLGVTVRSMDPSVAAAYGLPVGSQVATVEQGSCSAKAGLKEMDIIVKLGDYEIEDNSDLLRALRKFKAGDTTTITVWRSGAYVDLTITLDEKPHEETASAPDNSATTPSEEPSSGGYGSWPDWFFGRGFGG